MWNNQGVQKMFSEYGHRICAIALNNGKQLLIDYPGKDCVRLENITFDTIDGCDVMKIEHRNNSYGHELRFTSYVTTEFIENIIIMSEEDAKYRIDPLVL